MDKELEEYYRNMTDLFRMEGWKQLMAEFTETANQMNNVLLVGNTEDLFERKGKLKVIYDLLYLENNINLVLEEAENDKGV